MQPAIAQIREIEVYHLAAEQVSATSIVNRKLYVDIRQVSETRGFC